MRRSIALLLAVCLCGAAALAQESVFRTTTQLVVLDVLARSKKMDAPIAGLTADDFQVSEDGVRQKISVASRDKLPLSIVLLFDLTFTVSPVLEPLANGAMAALAHLKPEDEVAVMVYAVHTDLVQDFTTDRTRIVAAIQRASQMTSGDAAYFNEGVYQASAQLRKSSNPSSRRVVIWFTDNVPDIPRGEKNFIPHTEKETMADLFESGAVVCSLVERSAFSDFFIVFHKHNPMLNDARRKYPPGDVNGYTGATGGLAINSSKEQVATRLADMIDAIRSRYTLGYYPSTDQPAGKLCKVEVKLTPEAEKRVGQVVLRARSGYYRPRTSP